MNGNSTYDKAMSFKTHGDGRDLPWFFRHAMPVPVTLVSGL